MCRKNRLAIQFPEIAEEWHPTKNGNITAKDVAAGSNVQYWFQCKQGHEWKSTPNNRTRKTSRCPYCSNRKVCYENCLQTLFPNIADEWHPTKNGNITAKDVIAGSHVKYWFQCKKGHSWKATPDKRTRSQTGCPVCLESKGEKIINITLEKLGIWHSSQHRFKSCKNKNSLPFDFVIKTHDKIAVIEYNGEQHYVPVFGSNPIKSFQRTKKNDWIKKKWCQDNNIPLLEIFYWEMGEIEKLVVEFVETMNKTDKITC